MFDDQFREFRRCVIDAKPLPLGGFRHHGGGLIGLLTEQADESKFLQFGDRSLEQMPEHLDIHFGLEVVVPDRLEKMREFVIEFEVVDFSIGLEKIAVEAIDAVRGAAAIDVTEDILELLPSRVYDR